METNGFLPIDIETARMLARLGKAGENDSLITLAALLVSRATREGSICLDLNTLPSSLECSSELAHNLSLTDTAVIAAGNPLAGQAGIQGSSEVLIHLPSTDTWAQILFASGITGHPGELKPLILDTKNRLYLYRYHAYEQRLAAHLRAFSDLQPAVDHAALAAGLDQFFAPQSTAPDDQRQAAATAINQGLCVITGGPGTGKTTTVAKILILLLKQNPNLRIALAAPTGKAAYRLQAAITQTLETLDIPQPIKNKLPRSATTLHRLLGVIPSSSTFRHNASNRLPYDCVIIDEASMVDLALMTKLAGALPDTSRLILLGDKDQLASVQAGHVLGDICRGMAQNTPNPLCELRQNYRFSTASGIHALSAAVNVNTAPLSILTASTYTDLAFSDLPDSTSALKTELAKIIVPAWQPYLTTPDIAAKLELLNNLRILCAVRQGPHGVHRINELIEEILEENNLLRPDREFYHQRPIMITSNDYTQQLFNGDIGIILKDGHTPAAWFQNPQGELRHITLSRLPEHETVFAMSVHKSQGSEFNNVLLILPNSTSPMLTRELLYTAITRARHHLTIFTNPATFTLAASRKIERTSGLVDALKE